MATLYDPQGHPIDLAALREPVVVPSVTGVRQMFTDAAAAKLSPAQLGKILSAANEGDSHAYLTLAEEMEERDPHYASVLGTRKRALSGLEIKVEAASDDSEDVRIADAVRGLFADPDMEERVEDMGDAFGKGYSVHEILWETSEREWRPRLEWWDPRLFRYDRMGKMLLLKSPSEPAGLPLPPYKFLIHRARFKSGIPLRGGLARLVAWAHMMKTYGTRDWLAFLEVYGMPLRIGRYSANATADDKKALRRAVAQLGTDAAAILPEAMQIEFKELTKGHDTGELFRTLAEWLDRQVSKAVLGQTMTADDGSSKSQAEVHDGVREDIKKADARAMARTFMRDLVRPYVDLNFGPQSVYPRVSLHIPEPEDLRAKVEALEKLVPLGLRVSMSEVRDKLGFADPGEDEVLQAPGASPQAAPGAPGGAGDGITAENRRRALNDASRRRDGAPVEGGGEPDALDDLEALATGQWERILPQALAPVAKLATDEALNRMGDREALESFRARLADQVQSMDLGAFQELLARCRFMARTAGDVGASIG